MSARTQQLTVVAVVFAVVVALSIVNPGLAKRSQQPDDAQIQLGNTLYFDKTLSSPNGQSCASCHEPNVGFDDPQWRLPVSEGVIKGLFGSRNSPISAYAMYAPAFQLDDEGLWIGGQFWDGRGTGEATGDPLADQAMGPPLNPVEMANETEEQVIADILKGKRGRLFQQVCGSELEAGIHEAYVCMAEAIAAFERTELFAQFNSKYDVYLQGCLQLGGEMDDCAEGSGSIAEAAALQHGLLTEQEWYGLHLFMGENDNNGVLDPGEGAFCAACHVAEWTHVEDYALPVVTPAWAPDGWIPPVFTDFTYDNLGVPTNPEVLALIGDPNMVDLGLGSVLGDPEEYGKFKVMTLRNIGITAPYAHNGLFTTLEEIVHFYNTRDVLAEMWPVPEYPDTVNVDELGNLGLSAQDEAALVAFMKTLTDGHAR